MPNWLVDEACRSGERKLGPIELEGGLERCLKRLNRMQPNQVGPGPPNAAGRARVNLMCRLINRLISSWYRWPDDKEGFLQHLSLICLELRLPVCDRTDEMKWVVKEMDLPD